MTKIINDDCKNLGMYAEELFKREISFCQKNEDRDAAALAVKAAMYFGRAEYDDKYYGGQHITAGNHAIRLLDSLPPERVHVTELMTIKNSFPHTKAELLVLVFVALECSEEEEQYLKFASALMSPRNSKTEEEKAAVLDAVDKHLKDQAPPISSTEKRVKKFIAIIRQMPYRAENPIFRKLLMFIAKYGTKEDFRTLINFHKEDEPAVSA